MIGEIIAIWFSSIHQLAMVSINFHRFATAGLIGILEHRFRD